MARAYQNLVWARVRHTNGVRNALREYYPAAFETFGDLADRDTLAILGRAPTPSQGTRLTVTQIRAALKTAGRRRTLDATARKIQQGLRGAQLAAPGPVADAYGTTVASLVRIIAETNRQITELEETLHTRFGEHPDAAVYLSQPRLGTVLGRPDARRVFEVRPRPLHQRQVTPQLRRHVAHHHRHRTQTRRRCTSRPKSGVSTTPSTNRRFCSLTRSPGARAFYDQKRAAGDVHHQALRALANRLVGILHGCLKHQTPYNEHTAWAHRTATNRAAA